MRKIFIFYMIFLIIIDSVFSAENSFVIEKQNSDISKKTELEKRKAETKTTDADIPIKVSESFRQEGYASIRRGVDFLLSRQLPDGSWGTVSRGRSVGNPAITALAGMAIFGAGKSIDSKLQTKAVESARSFILKHARKDGSISTGTQAGEYPTYTTAIALTFLATLRRTEDESVMRAARKFLIGLQLDEDNSVVPTTKDDLKYGGFGYSPEKEGIAHADLSNTAWVAEALHASEYLTKEPYSKSSDESKESDLAWDKLAVFLTRMQNVPETNHAVWVVSSKDSDEYGGFIYHVESDENDTENEKTGQNPTLRTYGSMTYSGLKSMIYAKFKSDDPRVVAAVEWAKKHYTLNENPGMGSAGLFYYIQTFAKSHDTMKAGMILDANGKKHNWREDVIDKLLSTQKRNGEWENANGRWMESSNELVTTYCLLSLELALGNLLR